MVKSFSKKDNNALFPRYLRERKRSSHCNTIERMTAGQIKLDCNEEDVLIASAAFSINGA